MSDNSNEPVTKIHAGNLTCKASIEDFGSHVMVHVFFGKTPRAQLSIEFDTEYFTNKAERLHYIRVEIQARFKGMNPEISI